MYGRRDKGCASMQIRFACPIDTLSIDPNVDEALKECLLEPFENEAKAIVFWDNAETTLVHIQSRDDEAVYSLMDKLLKQQVAHGLKYIEHSFELTEPSANTICNGCCWEWGLLDNTVARCFKGLQRARGRVLVPHTCPDTRV